MSLDIFVSLDRKKRQEQRVDNTTNIPVQYGLIIRMMYPFHLLTITLLLFAVEGASFLFACQNQHNPLFEQSQVTNGKIQLRLPRAQIRHTNYLHSNRNDCVDNNIADESVQHELDTNTVTLAKPMGIILEEHKRGEGNFVFSIDPAGNSALASSRGEICCRDTILAVNGKDCSQVTFEAILQILGESSSPVSLKVGRPSMGSRKITFPNGITVAACHNEIYGNVAQEASYHDIYYECRSGSCGMCEHRLEEQSPTKRTSKKPRYVRPCSSKIPKGCNSLTLLASDRHP